MRVPAASLSMLARPRHVGGARRNLAVRTAVGALAISGVVIPTTAAQGAAPCGSSGTLTVVGTTASCTYTGPGNAGLTDAFTVPSTVNSVQLVAIGGKGGGKCGGGNAGGTGDEVSGTFTVTSSATLSIIVAGNGGTITCDGNGNGVGGSNAGGFGGGGQGGIGPVGAAPSNGAGGGGASKVQDGIAPLVIAGGGGGAGGAGLILGGNARQAGLGCPSPYGAGFQCSNGGQPGTSSAGGSGGNPGTAFTGGAGGDNGLGSGGGGGGGGLYGGGGGFGSSTAAAGGGGGGSSYASIGGAATMQTATTNVPRVTISWTVAAVTLTLDPIKNVGAGDTWAGTETGGSQAEVGGALAGATASSATGTVTYRRYASADCSGSPATSEAVNVDAGGTFAVSSPTSPLSPGTYSFQATYSGDATHSSAISGCSAFTVNKAPQSILFTSSAPASAAYGDTYDLAVTGGASGNAVALTVDAGSTSICELNASTVTFIGPGTCLITANQGGDASYLAAPQASQSITVSKARIRVDALPTTTQAGQAPTLSYELRAADLRRGDTLQTAGITGSAACTSGAASQSAGSYPGAITCAPGSLSAANYTFEAGASATLTLTPAPGAAPSLVMLRSPSIKNDTVTIQLRCTAAAPCRTTGTLTTTVKRLRGKPVSLSSKPASKTRKVETIGSASALVAAGATTSITVKLNRTGRQLRKRFGRIPATLTLRISGEATPVSTQLLTIKR